MLRGRGKRSTRPWLTGPERSATPRNRFGLELPADLSAPVTLSSGGVSVSMRLQGATARAAGSVEGSTVTYAGAMAGVDVVYTSLAEGLKEELVLASAATPRRFTFDVSTTGGRLVGDGHGGFQVLDAGGGVVWDLPPSFMTDAKGATAAVAMTVDGVHAHVER